MKRGAVALSGLAWLQLAAAACCRTNKCLKAVVSPELGGAGVQDCSSLLAVTVTPSASTVTETVTVLPTEHNTLVETAVFTETVTTTAATETQLFTIGTTVTASTHTDVVTITQTVLATQTEQRTVTTTLPAPTRIQPPVKARADTELVPSAIPTYAAADCASWEKYTQACKCAGVTATTVTAEAPPATTVTVTATGNAVTVPVPTTISTTETVFVSLTATTAATEVETVTVTATTTATESAVESTTITVTATVTETITPSGPTCLPASQLNYPFHMEATQSGNSRLSFFAEITERTKGLVTWKAAPSPVPQEDRAKYNWKLSGQGYLTLASSLPPYNYQWTPYIEAHRSNSDGSRLVNLGVTTVVDQMVNSGVAWTKIKACVNSVTGELTLNAGGRTNILFCGGQFWMSSGLGEDSGRGPCVQMFPQIAQGF